MSILQNDLFIQVFHPNDFIPLSMYRNEILFEKDFKVKKKFQLQTYQFVQFGVRFDMKMT